MSREIMQLALDALDIAQSLLEKSRHHDQILNAYKSLRQELAKPEPEPVAVWELQEGGWETIADADWMETLPIGTKLYALGQSK